MMAATMEQHKISHIRDVEDFFKYAKMSVAQTLNATPFKFNRHVCPNDISVVWSCKTLQNYKAILVVKTASENSFIEVTYNGDKKQMYIDIYSKVLNACVDMH